MRLTRLAHADYIGIRCCYRSEVPREIRGALLHLDCPPKTRYRTSVGVSIEHYTAISSHSCSDYRWSRENREFLRSRSSPLEFYLHRSQYIRLLLACDPPDYQPALSYANGTLRHFYAEHTTEFRRLLTCVVYLPKEKLERSPYADLTSPTVHTDLESLFAIEYCARLGMSRQVPLRVVGDIAAGSALARIEKAHAVMKERKSEWSQSDELPVSRINESVSTSTYFHTD